MAEKLAWLRKNGESIRTFLMLEPRGHSGMHGALLTEPVSPKAHAGLLSMHAAGFPMLSGEGVIAAVTIALEQKLIAVEDEELLIDTPAGQLRARPTLGAAGALGATGALGAKGALGALGASGARSLQPARGAKPPSASERGWGPPASPEEGALAAEPARVTGVALTGVPSFVHSAGLTVDIGARKVTIDVAFGGEFYVIADCEAIGIPIEMANASRLIRTGLEIKRAVESSLNVVHPIDNRQKGIQGTIFTGSSRSTADLRSATVLDGQVLRRSPGVTGTAALLAVLDAMELLAGDHAFTHEGVAGTLLRARALDRHQVDGVPMVVPIIEGSASITGFHEFVSNT
jgi:proline racemase